MSIFIFCVLWGTDISYMKVWYGKIRSADGNQFKKKFSRPYIIVMLFMNFSANYRHMANTYTWTLFGFLCASRYDHCSVLCWPRQGCRIFFLRYGHPQVRLSPTTDMVIMRMMINLLKPTGHVMHHQFNIQQLYFLPTLFVFCIYLRTNSDLCHLQHKQTGFYNRDEKSLQHGMDWVLK